MHSNIGLPIHSVDEKTLMNTPTFDEALTSSFTPVPGVPFWSQAMQRATLAQRAGQLSNAQFHYQQAITTASKWLLVADNPTPDECLSALVSSHLCLAGLQEEDGNNDSAATCLATVHQRLLAIIAGQDRASAWHQAAVWYSRDTHGALLMHLAHHGRHPAIERALHSGCMALCAASPQVH